MVSYWYARSKQDFYSYLRFIRFAPFDELKMWKKHIDVNTKPGDEEAMKTKTERLSQITVSMMLRREKEQRSKTTGEVFVSLPKKEINMLPIDMTSAERKAYDELAENGRRRVTEIIAEGEISSNAGMFEIFALLLRMRQFCTHPALIREAMDWESVVEGLEEVPDVETIALLEEKIDQPSLAKEVAALFDLKNHSCKTAAMIIQVREVLTTTPDKIVIASQWTGVLNIVEAHIKREITKVGIARIDGKVKLDDRANLIRRFNQSGGPRIMLLSITAGGCGLNMIGANHMILMDLTWNPAIELQAFDRLHRIGQIKPVHIYKYITTSTIENRVITLQKEKEELAQGLYAGTKARSISKLSINDIKYLFGIDDASKARDAARASALRFSQAQKNLETANLKKTGGTTIHRR